MKAAIELASFYLCQHKLILAHTGNGNKLEGDLFKIQTQAEKHYDTEKKGVSASFLKSRINSLKKMTTDAIRQLFKQLVSAGMGLIEGVGNKMVYIPFFNPGNGPNNDPGNGGNDPRNGGNDPGNNNGSIVNQFNGTDELIDEGVSPTIGAKLVGSPIDESESAKGIENTIGKIGDNNLTKRTVENIQDFPPSWENLQSNSETNNLADGSGEKTNRLEDLNDPASLQRGRAGSGRFNTELNAANKNTLNHLKLDPPAPCPPGSGLSESIDNRQEFTTVGIKPLSRPCHQHQTILNAPEASGSGSINMTNKSTNFTNSSAEGIDFTSNTAIGDDHQSPHQPPIKLDPTNSEIAEIDSEIKPPVNTIAIKLNNSTQWKALLNFYFNSYLILVENEFAPLIGELETSEIEIFIDLLAEQNTEIVEVGYAALPAFSEAVCVDICCADATVIKTMLGFFSTGFYAFFAPIQEQIEARNKELDRDLPKMTLMEQFRPTESELAEFEIELEVGMKVINKRSAERGIITAVCLREKTVTVEVDSGDRKRWYDNVVKPVPEQFFSYPKLINAIDLQIKRLGWSIDRASDYLFSQFRVRSRRKLNGEQLFTFLVNLQAI